MNDNELIFFVENLREKLNKKELEDDIKQSLGELYMLSEFKEKIEKNEEKDMIKYLALGWYVYNIILKQNNLK